MIKLERPICPNPKSLNNGNYKHHENKSALRKASHQKCMYCESKIDHVDHAHVEHIKPKSEDKFPNLMFDWGNLGYACSVCNVNKSDKYFKDAPFVDPYSEPPEDYLYFFGALMFERDGCPRGEVTIREIDLNRTELCERRSSKVKDIGKWISSAKRLPESIQVAAIEELVRESEPSREYSLLVKSMLKTAGII